jgi:hypothetical protein
LKIGLQASDPLNPAKTESDRESYITEDMAIHKHPATSFVDEVRKLAVSFSFYSHLVIRPCPR